MNTSIFSCLLGVVLQLTLIFKVWRHVFVRSIRHQDNEIDVLIAIVYQHNWIDQKVVLGMVSEEKNAFLFWCNILFGLPPTNTDRFDELP